MPFKNHEKYLEYQRNYYRKRKGDPLPTQGFNRNNTFNPGFTEGLNKNKLSSTSAVQSLPKKQGVTSTLNPSIPKGLKPSIPPSRPFPFNPIKPTDNKANQEHAGRQSGNARPISPRLAPPDDISEITRKHVEEVRRQGYEVDGLGNAHRIIKE